MKIVKLRRNQIAHTWSPQKFREVIKIPSTPNSFGRYEVQLKRIPLYQSPSLTICKFLNTLTSLTETSGTPNSGEYCIDYMPINDSQSFEGSGIITFNVADAGKWIIIEYYEVGSFDIEELYNDDKYINNQINIREIEAPIITNYSVFSYPREEFSNTKNIQNHFICIDSANNVRRYFIDADGTTYYVYENDQTYENDQVAIIGTRSSSWKTFVYLDDNRRVHVFGTRTDAAKYWIKSVNTIDGDLGGSNSLSSTMPYFLQHAGSVKVGNMLYVFGGSSTVFAAPYSKSFKIDLNTNTVTLLADLPSSSDSKFTAIYKDGYIYILNAWAIYKYDIVNNTYTTTTINLSSIIGANTLLYNDCWVENKQGIIQVLCYTSDSINNGFAVLCIDIDNSRWKVIQINNSDYLESNKQMNARIFSKNIQNLCNIYNPITGYKKPGDNSKVFLSLTESPVGEAYLLAMTGDPSVTPDGMGGYYVNIPRCSYKIGGTNYSTTGTLSSGIVANGQYVWLTTSGTIGSGAYPTDQKVCPILRVVNSGSNYDSFGMKHTYPEVKKLHSVYFTGFPVDFD